VFEEEDNRPGEWKWKERWWKVAEVYNETQDVLTAAAEAGYSVRNALRIVERLKRGEVAPLPFEEKPEPVRGPIYRERQPWPKMLEAR